jgi:polyketide biosynthesis 3-hydroxy-3-methylglutaryl-CoA synthase-like enzyme PksG
MSSAGVEALNIYAGRACIDVAKLGAARKLDSRRFDNLLLRRKSVALPDEDPVTFAVNAAKPLIDVMDAKQRKRVELLLVATESGLDFGKPLSTYVHSHLGLARQCRTLEIKHACYAGTGALQMAAAWVASGASPGAKALVVCADVARIQPNSYAEPSQGAAAVAMLVGDQPSILDLDAGANGCYGYEVMDTFRPNPEIETGNPDLSLLTYMDCMENSFLSYANRVAGADFQESFDYLACHTPFGGMVKGAHRSMMRKFKSSDPEIIEADFHQRVAPALTHCQEVGNIYSGTVFLALAGVIDSGNFDRPRRVGLFSYGSGCCSEFYSGIVGSEAAALHGRTRLVERLRQRRELGIEEYDEILRLSLEPAFGTRHFKRDSQACAPWAAGGPNGCQHLVFTGINDYHREYDWA